MWTTFYDDDDAQVILLFADNYAMLLVGRFLTGAVHNECSVFDNFSGFSGGAFVMAAPAYIAEIAETK